MNFQFFSFSFSFLILGIFLQLLYPYQGADTDVEDTFLSIPNATIAREHLFYYTSIPHIAGSPEDYETANYTKQKMLEYGVPEVEIVAIEMILTYPIERSVQIPSINFTASLFEPPLEFDPTSSDNRSVATFNGYGPSGNVTAEVIYVNYGALEDYDILEANNISVAGKIVLARYGQIFRGTKAMIAQMKGAVGVLIYSDPKDDGFVRGQVYPDGPWRPKDGVQRGSVQFLSICPGEPGRKVCSNDPNYNYDDGVPKIPVQPLSWGDAEPILNSLTGAEVPEAWKGGIDNITYRFGPGPELYLYVDVNITVTPIWNVIGKFPGETEPDRQIILGNHRDAWVFGATDPNSGSSTMLEVARGLGTLYRSGWRPRRTIIFASWDGEEYGLLGSTSYGENKEEELHREAVAYLNVDTAVSGLKSTLDASTFGAAATPSLSNLIREASQRIIEPVEKKPLSEVWNGKVGRLGSGSDYTVFIDYIGIPSTDIRFSGNQGIYHSIYDSFTWMENYGDPTFEYHKCLSQLWGLMTLRLADAEILPFDFEEYHRELEIYTSEIKQLVNDANAPIKLDKLEQSIASFGDAANKVKQEKDSLTKDASPEEIRKFNDKIMTLERNFIYAKGLPKRPWYKNMIQAPGFYQGYAPDVFPGIAQPVRDGDWETAESYVNIIAERINAAADHLSSSKSRKGSKKKNVGLYVGVSLGGAALIVLALGAAYYYYNKRKYSTYEVLQVYYLNLE